jgi:UDP-glucose 4-epimerase
MKVLVTGGSGRIGKFVVMELQKYQHEVRIFDTKEPESINSDFFNGSITEPTDIERAMNGIDAVIHLAAIPSMMSNIPSVDYMNINVAGTFNVLEAAAKSQVSKVAIASSDSALGFVFSTNKFSPEYFPINEKHPLQPQDPYGLSKLIGEELCKSATRRYGISTICLRFCWVWFPDTYQHRSHIVNNEVELNIKRMWGYADVHDIAQACRLSVEAENISHEAFFISARNTFTEEPSLELMRRYYPEVESISNEYLIDKHKSLFDISKAEKLLGYTPKYDWHEAS